MFEEARQQAAALHRSPPQQIEHWAWLGKVMESALSLPAQQQVKRAALSAQLDEALDVVGTSEGIRRARQAVGARSVKIVSND